MLVHEFVDKGFLHSVVFFQKPSQQLHSNLFYLFHWLRTPSQLRQGRQPKQQSLSRPDLESLSAWGKRRRRDPKTMPTISHHVRPSLCAEWTEHPWTFLNPSLK